MLGVTARTTSASLTVSADWRCQGDALFLEAGHCWLASWLAPLPCPVMHCGCPAPAPTSKLTRCQAQPRCLAILTSWLPPGPRILLTCPLRTASPLLV